MRTMIRLRTIVAIGLLIGCTPLPPAPNFSPADGSPSRDSSLSDLPDAPADGEAPAPDVALDGDAPAPLDGPADADVVQLDAPPDGPTPGAARLTGTFVSSGSSSPRLSGGFVWHGGSARLSGWLQ